MTHREQKTFTITLNLSADFADDYGGDEDGFAWHERFQQSVRPALVTAVYEALRAHAKFRVVAAPRGRDPESALDLELSFDPRNAGKG